MIYGFSFSYTPSDTARGVKEEFRLEPLAEISWGDPSLYVAGTRMTEERLYAGLRYNIKPFQERWIALWESSVFPAVSGVGSASVTKGYSAKLDSYKSALKEAAREYLRKRYFNKPKEVTGELILTAAPYCVVDAGEYIGADKPVF